MTTLPFANPDSPDYVPLRPYRPVWVFGAGWQLNDTERCPEPDFETGIARAHAGFSDPLGELSPEALALPSPPGLLGIWDWLLG